MDHVLRKQTNHNHECSGNQSWYQPSTQGTPGAQTSARRVQLRIRNTLPAMMALAILAQAGCASISKLGERFAGNEPPIVKESEDGEVYPNLRFQSPDGPVQQETSLGQLRGTFDTQSEPADRQNQVADVIIKGNTLLPTHQILRHISTRPGRYFDPDRLQQDVDKIWRLPEVQKIKGPYIKKTTEGVEITIEIIERNQMGVVKFVGNRGITDRALKKETGLADGQPLDSHAIRMAKSKIETYYKEKGYPRTQVEIIEGDDDSDQDVVFLIHEDQQQRVWNVEFEGNTFASSARLKNFIKSKPGVMKVFGGLVKRDEIQQDVLRLSDYYRKFGFFNAQIGREISESNDGRWLTLRFIINEGPRYKVRNVSFIGNAHYPSDELNKLVQLRPEDNETPEYNVGKLNEDIVALRDLYGSQGFVFVKVDAEPRFLEDPGWLDIVYRIDEGKQYRVGKINVHIDGDYGITKRQVVLNRLSLRPGDLIDVRKIRNSERRLGSARIFAGGEPGSGAAPQIVVRPPELAEIERTASRRSSPTQATGSSSRNRF